MHYCRAPCSCSGQPPGVGTHSCRRERPGSTAQGTLAQTGRVGRAGPAPRPRGWMRHHGKSTPLRMPRRKAPEAVTRVPGMGRVVTHGDLEGPGAGTAPVEGQQQGPQWGEEGLLNAGQAAVLGDGRVEAFESQEGQREQPVCRERADTRHCGPAGSPWTSPRRVPHPPPSLCLPAPASVWLGHSMSWLSGGASCLALPSLPFTSPPPGLHGLGTEPESGPSSLGAHWVTPSPSPPGGPRKQVLSGKGLCLNCRSPEKL